MAGGRKIHNRRKKKDPDYHANLQKAAKGRTPVCGNHSAQIRIFPRFGTDEERNFFKDREYLKIADCSYTHVKPESLYTFPAGEYAVCFFTYQGRRRGFRPAASLD